MKRLRTLVSSGTILLAAAGIAVSGVSAKTNPQPQPWWTSAVIYEIYPRSFQDSNGDGVGDLKGITQRLDYLKSLGVDAIWITPFFPSPNVDFGYDVADYTSVSPEYGTMADWDELAREARKRGIRVMVDFVLNHSSDQHPWFRESRSSRTNPKRDWYVWRDAAPDGGPPTNWKSIFGGSTWEYDEATKQYYYHVFYKQQPDLNWANPDVRKAMNDVVRFWLSHGASGFRLDATPYLFEDTAWPQDPAVDSGPPAGLKPYNSNRPENHGALRELRKTVDSFPGDPVMLGENAISTFEGLRSVYGTNGDEIHLPMNFLYTGIKTLDAGAFKARIDEAELKLDGLPPVFHFSNHDTSRQWTRYGDGVNDEQIARLTSAMTLTLRGAALMYYGEEIGMSDLKPDELVNFPLRPTRKVRDHRDPVRSPMQWTGDAGAGFSNGAPWLPVARTAATRSVAAQRADTRSMHRWYTRLLNLRKTNPALRSGAYIPLESGNKDALAYARQDRSGRGVLVLLNMSAQRQGLKLSGWPGARPRSGAMLMSSTSAGTANLSDPVLEPYASLLISYRM